MCQTRPTLKPSCSDSAHAMFQLRSDLGSETIDVLTAADAIILEAFQRGSTSQTALGQDPTVR